jgi:hypothetical protein
MPLIDLTTNLRDLKFGRDRVAGGSSNQPYVQSDIPALDKESSGLGYLNQDFVVRGGLKAVVNSVKDVERLSKYFFDIRNPSGLLFIAKQNLLSRLAVQTQASKKLNEGVYTPLGTLAQAGDVAFGLHTNKQGLNPFDNFRVGAGATDPTSLGGYFFAVTDANTNKLESTTTTESSQPDINASLITDNSFQPDISNSLISSITVKNKRNRLLGLYNDLLISEEIQSDILSYPGGPGSILGIGKTNIKFATGNGTNDVRTGVNNADYRDQFYWNPNNPNKKSPLGLSNTYWFYTPFTLFQDINNGEFRELDKYFLERRTARYDMKFNIETTTLDNQIRISRRGNIDTLKDEPVQISDDEPLTYTYPELMTVDSNSLEDLEELVQYERDRVNKIINSGQSAYIGKEGVTTPGDFRALLRSKGFINIPVAPNYNSQNIEAKLGDPGNRNGKNLQFYERGVGSPYGAASFNSYDKINASDINDKNKNKDLIPFKIEKISNNDPTATDTIQFRAFLDSITDSFTSEWKNERYVGRGENFYTYSGFDRKVSLSWTVAAQSKAELIPMYKKLSYLASICAPDYSDKGYMRGNIVKLTIGGYFFQQPGIITGFSYEMNEDNATWEIGIDSVGEDDDTTSQLPHLIKVKGFNFTPIHTFTPELGIWENSPFIAISPPSLTNNVS